MIEGDIFSTLINIVAFFNRTDRDKKMVTDAGVNLEATSLQSFTSIGRMQPTNVSDLANLLGKSHSSTSRQIDKLEKNGLIETQPSQKDARIRVIRLSKQGEQITSVINATRLKTMQSAFSDWSDSDKKQLLDSLEHLNQTLTNIN